MVAYGHIQVGVHDRDASVVGQDVVRGREHGRHLAAVGLAVAAGNASIPGGLAQASLPSGKHAEVGAQVSNVGAS